MKKGVLIKIISVFCVLILLPSCGYKLALVKKGDAVTQEQTPAVTDETIYYVPQTDASGEPVTGITETTSGEDPFSLIVVDGTYTALPIAGIDVLELYKRAMYDVKLRCPGFTRKGSQEVSDVRAGSGELQMMNNIMALVATEVLNGTGDENEYVSVVAHDDIAVRKLFPLYNKDTGCELNDLNIIKSAACYSDGSTYKIVLTLFDQKNPSPETSEFAKILVPIDRDAIHDAIKQYLVVLDLNSYTFDVTYRGCEITCVMDKETMRMSSLTMKTIMDIDLNLNLDLGFLKTNNITATGSIISHVDYYGFDWSND